MIREEKKDLRAARFSATTEVNRSDGLDLGENWQVIGLVYSSLRRQRVRPTTERARHDAFPFWKGMLYYDHYSTLCYSKN